MKKCRKENNHKFSELSEICYFDLLPNGCQHGGYSYINDVNLKQEDFWRVTATVKIK